MCGVNWRRIFYLSREGQVKRCASVDGVFRPNPTPVALHDSFGDSKAQACAAFGRMSAPPLERHKDRLKLVKRNARTVVPHTHQNIRRLIHNRYLNIRASLREFDGISDHVKEYLGHLPPVQGERRHPLGIPYLNVRTFAVRYWAGECDGLFNHQTNIRQFIAEPLVSRFDRGDVQHVIEKLKHELTRILNRVSAALSSPPVL